MGTDRDWERWGANNPYFGVCSDGKFQTDSLTSASRGEFFASGEVHVARTWRNIEHLFDLEFSPESAVDFGCGVGRLVIPFARRIERVVGVDISPSMLAEAKRNCSAVGIRGAEFVESDDGLSLIHGVFDLVHSHIVLQHIPWKRGRNILRSLATHVAPGGVLAVQILSGYEASRITRGLAHLRYGFPPANWLRNLLRSRPLFEPAMQLHVYDFRVVRDDLEKQGFECKQIDERFDGFRSTLVYARRLE